jgi:hypothetical protein
MAARRKNAAQGNAPHRALHTAPSPHPAPVAHPPADGLAAAVWAALVAAPGATAAQIATDARTSRAIAGRELAVLETSDLATRTPGERKGRTTAPATWQPAPCAAAPAPGTIPASLDETDPAGMAGTPAASPTPAGGGNLPGPGSELEPDETGGRPWTPEPPAPPPRTLPPRASPLPRRMTRHSARTPCRMQASSTTASQPLGETPPRCRPAVVAAAPVPERQGTHARDAAAAMYR